MLHHPGILGYPQTKEDKLGGRCTPTFSGTKEGGNATSPLHSLGSPNKGGQNHSLPHPYLLKGPEKWQKCYITPAFSEMPQTNGEKVSGCPTPAFSEGQNRAKMLYHPRILGDPQTNGDKFSGCLTPTFSGALKRAKMLHHLCILGDPQTKADKISGCLILAFMRAQKRSKVLCHPWILGDPQIKGGGNEWLPHPCLLEGPKEGPNAMSTLHSWGSQNKGGQNQCVPHPCVLGHPKEGQNATSP